MTVDEDLRRRVADLESENTRLRGLLEQAGMPGELRHQIRNALAMMRAILRRSAESRTDVENYAALVESRFDALLRVQHLVLHGAPGDISLSLLVSNELQAQLVQEGEQAQLAGPTVLLQVRAAEVLALAIHELTINAVEFGKLAQPDGRLRVHWDVHPDEAGSLLTLVWSEPGSTANEADFGPTGFGTEVLQRMLGYELKAAVARTLADGELRYDLRLPLTAAVGRVVETT